MIIQIGDEKHKFDLPEIGGLTYFKEVKLGTIDLPLGEYKIMVKGASDNWQEYYFSKIELKPTSEGTK
jgi:hypothetical protein